MINYKPSTEMSFSNPSTLPLNMSTASSLIDNILICEAEYDREAEVEYVDTKTGKKLSFEDYWAKRRFESQPFYILGKLLRETTETLLDGTKHIFSYLGKIVRNNYEYLTFDAKKLEQAIIENNTTQINNLLQHHNDYIRSYVEYRLKQHKQVEQKISDQYQKLSQKIETALQGANYLNKPLLILIGEEHFNLNSAITEAIVLHIVADKFPGKGLLSESFFMKYYESFFLCEKKRCDLFPFNVAEKLANELGVQKTVMDYANCGHHVPEGAPNEPPECETKDLPHHWRTEADSISVEGMRKRNEVMSEVAIQNLFKNKVAIVGASHLPGLIEDTKLTDYFEVLPLNLIDFVLVLREKSELIKYISIYLNPNISELLSHYPSFYDDNENYITSEESKVFINSDTIIQKTRKAHQQAKMASDSEGMKSTQSNRF